MSEVQMSMVVNGMDVATIKSLSTDGTLPDDAHLVRDPEHGVMFVWYKTVV